MTRSGFSLVLGGGGWPAHAYLGGVLAAVVEVGGLDPRRSRLTVGTSAGALQAALVAAGTPPNRLRELALQLSNGGHEKPFVRNWSGPRDLCARLVGSSIQVGSMAGKQMNHAMRYSPGFRYPETGRYSAKMRQGLIRTRDPERYFGLLPPAWPDADLAVVAYDLRAQRRRILTRATSAGLDLRQAVEASMTLPGLMQPVAAGRERLVDGGVASPTNLDVATQGPARVVIAVAPMAFDPRRPPRPSHRLAYRRLNTALARQAGALRASGQRLILIRPGATELDVMGVNFLRIKDAAAIARLAYDQAARELTTSRSLELIDEARMEDQ